MLKCFQHACFPQKSFSSVRPIHSRVSISYIPVSVSRCGAAGFGFCAWMADSRTIGDCGFPVPSFPSITTRCVRTRARPGTEGLGSLVLVSKSSSPLHYADPLSPLWMSASDKGSRFQHFVIRSDEAPSACHSKRGGRNSAPLSEWEFSGNWARMRANHLLFFVI